MDPAGAWRWTFAASALLALIAGLMLFAGATESERYFSWTIEPAQTAAFLGATYWAAVALFVWSAGRRTWAEMRLAALSETVVGTVLLAATLLHLDKFHDDLYGYFWIAAYALAAPTLIVLVFFATRSPRFSFESAEGRDAAQRLPAGLRVLLAVQASVFAVYGVALFADPGWANGAWPWALTPLTARAIAAFLLGFAVAAAVGVREVPAARLRGAAWAYLALGLLEILGAVLHEGDFSSDGAQLAFVAASASVAATGYWGLRASSARSGS